MIRLSSCPVCQSVKTHSYSKLKAQMHSSKEVFNFDECENCKLVYLNPRLPNEELKKYYSEYYLPYRGAKAWGKYAGIVNKSLDAQDRKRVRLAEKWGNLNPNSLILDIGCGKPSFLNECKNKVGCNTLGIDFNDEGWTNRNNEEYPDIKLEVAEIKDLTEDTKPDLITMWHYLEHDYAPLQNLKHLKTIAKPTTKIIIEVPDLTSLTQEMYGDNWAGWHTPRHLSLFSPKNIELLLNNSGWNVLKIENYGTMDAYFLDWLSRMEIKGIDWKKNMEDEFPSFLLEMIKFLPKKLKKKSKSLGLMTIVAEPKSRFV